MVSTTKIQRMREKNFAFDNITKRRKNESNELCFVSQIELNQTTQLAVNSCYFSLHQSKLYHEIAIINNVIFGN